MIGVFFFILLHILQRSDLCNVVAFDKIILMR
jgi:hypothetical protein